MISILSFIPIIGIVFSIITFRRAKKEWKRIAENPEKYSGKRKVLLAHTVATTFLWIWFLEFL
jgi:hypothetical protein